jgi:hypothetical protein
VLVLLRQLLVYVFLRFLDKDQPLSQSQLSRSAFVKAAINEGRSTKDISINYTADLLEASLLNIPPRPKIESSSTYQAFSTQRNRTQISSVEGHRLYKNELLRHFDQYGHTLSPS